MIIQTAQIKVNVEYFPSAEKEPAFVFLLHGFTGSCKDWLEIIPNLNKKFSYVAIDLVGHGKSEVPESVEPYKAVSLVQQLDEVFSHFNKNKFILLGYSMGGRVALTYAVHHPEKLSALILESTSAGFADEKLLEERRQSDAKIINLIREKPLEEFVEFWMNQDLFSTLNSIPEDKLLKAKAAKLLNSKIGLINSLKGFGTGVMPALYSKIHLVECPTLLITGELDKKFTQLNSEFVSLFPNAKHIFIKDAGHNVHLEKPEEFLEVVRKFLDKI